MGFTTVSFKPDLPLNLFLQETVFKTINVLQKIHVCYSVVFGVKINPISYKLKKSKN